MNKVIIRQAAEPDLDALTEIVIRYRNYQGVAAQEFCEVKKFIGERIKNSESAIFIAVSEASGSVVGFVQLYPVFSTVSLQKQWLLNDFFVDEEERGSGIGSALMESIKEHFRDIAKGFILVAKKTNSGAKRFYEKHGWKTDVFDFYTYFYDVNN